MVRRLLVVVLSVLLVGVVVGCGGDDGEESEASGTSVPDTPAAPFGLDGVEMPDTESELVAVFDAMPDEIDGAIRSAEDYALSAQYGEVGGVVAGLVPESEAAGAPSPVLGALRSFDGEIESGDLESDELVWLVGSFDEDGGAGEVFVALWGHPDGAWVVSVNARTPETRQALAEAFVGAAAAPADAPPLTAVGGVSLDEVRNALPSAEDLSAVLGGGRAVDVSGGPGAVGGPMLEGFDPSGVVGGYVALIRDGSGAAEGFVSVTLFETDEVAASALSSVVEEGGLDDEMIRSDFEVEDLLDEGRGYVLDPEPDSHFTDVVGRAGPLVMGVVLFHGPDDDRIDDARALVELVVDDLDG